MRDDELAELRAAVAAMQRQALEDRARITELEAQLAMHAGTSAHPAEPGGAAGTTTAPTDRRGFLRLASAAAAGAAGAVAIGVTGAEPAAAATGGPLLIGQANQPTGLDDTTRLDSASASFLSTVVFRASNTTAGPIAINGLHKVAVAGTTSGESTPARTKVGVLGQVGGGGSETEYRGYGVWGIADQDQQGDDLLAKVGVRGTARAIGFGAAFGGHFEATGPNSVGALVKGGLMGVAGSGAIGVAGSGSPGTGIDFDAIGTGRIRQQPMATVGAPTFEASQGESIRDDRGDLYLCVTGGTPGTWRKVTAQHPKFADAGGSINLLSSPIRILDTRGGAPIGNGGQRMGIGQTKNVQVTGTVVNSISVPSGATGAIGNITVVDGLGGGFVKLYPQGTPEPGTSAVNYVAGPQATANSFICRLAANGQLTAKVGVSATHVVIDIVGFTF